MAVEHAAAHHAAHAAGHSTAAAGHSDIPELANVITMLSNRWHDHPLLAFLHHWEDLVFSLAVAVFLITITYRYTRRPSIIPKGWQNALEMLVEGFDTLVQGVIGPTGRAHTPFIGSVFLYIWLMNLSGLLPGMKSATANLSTTMGLALVVFCYVQGLAIRSHGLLKYVDHLAGSPRDVVGWVMVPLMLPIHLLGELIKPLSLSLRLGFNIFAEDVLIAVLVGLGIAAGTALHLPIGIPFQFLVVPLILIFSTVQALVFSLLTTVYIALALPQTAHAGHAAESHH